MAFFSLIAPFLFLSTSFASYSHQDLMRALKESEYQSIVLIENDEKIGRSVKLFQKVFTGYSKKLFKEELPNLYAKEAFINDRIHSVKGLMNIQRYFLKTFKKLKKAHFKILDVAYGKRDAYIRWEMILYLKIGSKPFKHIGMSQLRFNEEGKIIYHQDHWDYSEVLQQMPFIKHLMNGIKNNS